jgi:hypothetical protein
MPWKSNKSYIFWVYVCSLSYASYNVYVPYFHLWPVWLYFIFPHSRKQHSFLRGEKILNTKYVFWFSLQILSKTFLILRGIQRDIIINLHGSLCEVLTILVRFSCNLNFRDRFSKNTQISNLMKIRPVGAGLFHVGIQKNRHDEANHCFFFCNFANLPKMLMFGTQEYIMTVSKFI